MATRKCCCNCENYKSSFGVCPEGYVFISDNLDSCLGTKFGICKAGNNDTMKNWWDNNGHLNEHYAEELPCYQAREFDAAIDRLLEMATSLCNKKFNS